MIPTLALLSLSLFSTSGGDATAREWPQWRGPQRDGQVSGPAWPDHLERLEQSWRVDGLGPSYSGPIIAAGRVFTTATLEEREERVQAFDCATGEALWDSGWSGAMKVPFFAARNGSWIRSTPACDGESLFVAGMRDTLVSLDVETGQRRWSVDFVEQLGTENPDFGFVSSPLLQGDHVYVQAGKSFLKLDKRTGEIVWRSLDEAPGMHSPFSSPILAELAGRQQLVVQTRENLVGVDPDSGGELWSLPVKSFRGMNILTPLVVEDGIFTAAYGGRAQRIEVRADA